MLSQRARKYCAIRRRASPRPVFLHWVSTPSFRSLPNQTDPLKSPQDPRQHGSAVWRVLAESRLAC